MTDYYTSYNDSPQSPLRPPSQPRVPPPSSLSQSLRAQSSYALNSTTTPGSMPGTPTHTATYSPRMPPTGHAPKPPMGHAPRPPVHQIKLQNLAGLSSSCGSLPQAGTLNSPIGRPAPRPPGAAMPPPGPAPQAQLAQQSLSSSVLAKKALKPHPNLMLNRSQYGDVPISTLPGHQGPVSPQSQLGSTLYTQTNDQVDENSPPQSSTPFSEIDETDLESPQQEQGSSPASSASASASASSSVRAASVTDIPPPPVPDIPPPSIPDIPPPNIDGSQSSAGASRAHSSSVASSGSGTSPQLPPQSSPSQSPHHAHSISNATPATQNAFTASTPAGSSGSSSASLRQAHRSNSFIPVHKNNRDQRTPRLTISFMRATNSQGQFPVAAAAAATTSATMSMGSSAASSSAAGTTAMSGTSEQTIGGGRSRAGTQTNITGRVKLGDDGDIKFADPEYIIGKLVTNSDSSYMNHFLYTFNLYMKPQELLDKLIEIYYNTEDDPTKKTLSQQKLRITVVLNTWIEKLWNTSTDPTLIQCMREFISTIAQDGPRGKLSRTLDRKTLPDGNESKMDFVFTQEAPASVVPLDMCFGAGEPPKEVNLNIPVREIARQLALVEQNLFRAIKPWEFQNLNFAKKDKSLSPNIHAFSAHFNSMNKWFVTLLMSKSVLSERIRTLERLIELAGECLLLQNYNGVNEIISACTSSAVFRLHKTWGGITPSHRSKFNELTALMASAKNYATLRRKIHAIHPPCVPYIGIYQTDLTFIEEGNPTLNDGLVNWQKCKLQANIITEINTYQQSPYCITKVPWLYEFLETVDPEVDENKMWNISMEFEPREKKQAPGEAQSNVELDYTQVAGLPTLPDTETYVKVTTDGGFKQFFIPFPKNMKNDGIVDHIHNFIKDKKLVPNDQTKDSAATKATAAAAAESLSLIIFTEDMPFGILAYDSESTISDMRPRMLALYRNFQMIDIIYPKNTGKETIPAAGHLIQMALDYHSPVYSLISVITDVFRLESSEFVLMRYKDSEDPRWIDINLSLKDQGFDCSTEKLVIVFTSVFMRSDSNRVQKLQRSTSIKQGTLYKLHKRFLLRPGIFPRPIQSSLFGSPASTAGGSANAGGAAASSTAADKSASLSTSVQTSRSRFKGLGRSTSTLATANNNSGNNNNGGNNGGNSGDHTENVVTEEGKKRHFVFQDNLLFVYSEQTSAAPKEIWILDYCNISLGTLTSGQSCIVIRFTSKYPFKHSSKDETLIVADSEDNNTRLWFSVFLKRCRTAYSQRSIVFSENVEVNSLKARERSFIPHIVRSSLTQITNSSALYFSSLFTPSSTFWFRNGSDSYFFNLNAAGTSVIPNLKLDERGEWVLEDPNAAANAADPNALDAAAAGCPGDETDYYSREEPVPEESFAALAATLGGAGGAGGEGGSGGAGGSNSEDAAASLTGTISNAEILRNYKESANNGIIPEAKTPLEFIALSQLVAMFFAETFSAFTFRLHGEIGNYFMERYIRKTAKPAELLERVFEMTKLPDCNMTLLYYLLSFFTQWKAACKADKKVHTVLTNMLFRPSDIDLSKQTNLKTIAGVYNVNPAELYVRFSEELLSNFRDVPLFAKIKNDGSEFFKAEAQSDPVFIPQQVGVLSKTDIGNVTQLVKSVEPALSLDDIIVKTSLFTSSSRQRQTSIMGVNTPSYTGKYRASVTVGASPLVAPRSSPLASNTSNSGQHENNLDVLDTLDEK